MLKIGDFSKVCQLSIRTLRHWDELGLLRPAQVDAHSGYRYYSLEQLDEVNRILAFRLMGLSLEQIHKLLKEQLSAAEIRGMLRLKQAEMEQQIEQAQRTLNLIEWRLQQMEGGAAVQPYETTLKTIPAERLYSIREKLPAFSAMVERMQQLHPYALRQEGAGLLAIFHDPHYDESEIDVELGFPAGSLQMPRFPLADGSELHLTEVAEIPLVATTVHVGQWTTLSHAYGYLGRWIETNGYVIAAPGREYFHQLDWQNQQRNTVTELQFPVQKR